MAMFKVARNRAKEERYYNYDTDQEWTEGSVCKYLQPVDVYQLLNYCMNKSVSVYYNYTAWDADTVAGQFVYIQRCAGKNLATRAHHFILSFDSWKNEKNINTGEMDWIAMRMSQLFFEGYQAVFCMHTDRKSHYHMHIIVNPVNLMTYELFRYDIKEMKRELDWFILKDMKLVLQGESYYDEKGKRCYGEEYGDDLYQYKLKEEVEAMVKGKALKRNGSKKRKSDKVRAV